MTVAADSERWKVLSRLVEIRSHYLTMIGERLQDTRGRELEYWRVEKPDSLLIITIQRGRMVLPARSYRPGVGRTTLDFAGGRLEDPDRITETALEIVQREFELDGGDPLVSLEPLTSAGWDVDSSSSSQQVYGVVAELTPARTVPERAIGACHPATAQGAREPP